MRSRNLVVEANRGAEISHVVLCGTPNRGVFDWRRILAASSMAVAVSADAERPCERCRPRNCILNATQRRQRQIPRKPDGRLLGRPGRADRHHVRGAKPARRDQSGAWPARPSRSRLPSACLPRDLPLHRRPRACSHCHHSGGTGGAGRTGHRQSGRGTDQSPGHRRGDRGVPRLGHHGRADWLGNPEGGPRLPTAAGVR